MLQCCTVCRFSRRAAPHAAFASARFGQAAEELTTLVQSCYPTASVIFPCLASCTDDRQQNATAPCSFSDGLGDAHARLQSTLAARGGLHGEAVDAGLLQARLSWGTTHTETNHSMLWSELIARLSPPQQLFSSRLFNNTAALSPSPPLCSDAILYLDGVEATDVAKVVAPRLMRDIPAIVECDSVGSSTHTHTGQRQDPIYCRRQVDWARLWREKRCAMRGVDLMELSLPLPAKKASASTAASRASLLVSVANPSVTLAALHRQKNSARRGPLRSTFGYSLPCLQNALPAAVVQCVRLLRAWQEDKQSSGTTACTSAFWVSAVGHVLDDVVRGEGETRTSSCQAISTVLDEWLSAAGEENASVTSEEGIVLRYLKLCATSEETPRTPSLASMEGQTEVLANLLFAAVLQRLRCEPIREWNAYNFFLPPERFEGTTDMTSALALSEKICQDTVTQIGLSLLGSRAKVPVKQSVL